MIAIVRVVLRGLCGLAACVTLGCQGDSSAPPMPPITYQSVTGAAAPAREPTATELPVAEDFEQSAEAEITRDNFRQELERLEAEVTGDTGR